MTKLGEMLANNDEKLIQLQPRLKNENPSWWRRLFLSFTFEGDLIHYILTPKTTDRLASREREYSAVGLPTCREIVERYIALNPSKTESVIKFSGLLFGHRYSSRDICSLANNHNENLGMYMGVDEEGRAVAILKATINGGSYRKERYDDEWLDSERTKLRYCLQREPATSNFEFSKKENRAIFDGLITDMPVTIYLFVNYPKESDYEYVGTFEANSLSADRKSFTLVKTDNRAEESNFYEYEQFVRDYISTNFNNIVSNTPLLLERDLPSGLTMVASQRSFNAAQGNPDYIQLQRKLKILGNFGEEKALQFERDRVSKFAKDYAEQVIRVDNDREGYDIRSFWQDGKQIRELKLEVKTTTDANGINPFFMSANEFDVMKQSSKDYWLYRLFNIHSTRPSFYALKGNVAQKVIFKPSEYACYLAN